MDAIALLKAHFSERRLLVIPEIVDGEGNPLSVYWRAVSAGDMAKMQRAVATKGSDGTEAALRLIIAKAETEAGEKMFDLGDLPTLRDGVDAGIISRLSEAMLSIVNPGNAVKN